MVESADSVNLSLLTAHILRLKLLQPPCSSYPHRSSRVENVNNDTTSLSLSEILGQPCGVNPVGLRPEFQQGERC